MATNIDTKPRVRISALLTSVLLTTMPLQVISQEVGSGILGGALVGAVINQGIQKQRTERSSVRTLPTIRPQTEVVRRLQTDLNTLGYPVGLADGIFGARTRAAVEALFRDAGLSPPQDVADVAAWVGRAAEQANLQNVTSPAAAGYLSGVAYGYSFGVSGQATPRPVVSGSPTPAAAVAAQQPQPTVSVAAVRPVAASAAVPTRKFAAPDEYPPEGFRGYGVIAFKSLATDFDRVRHNIICEAYIAALVPNALEKSRNIDKFVTIWPIMSEEKSSKLNSTPISGRGEICSEAINHYNAQLADRAIRAARKAGFEDTGRGPFFLGWLPSDGYGRQDALIIVMDMSLVETYTQAEALIAEWKLDIQSDPSLLRNPYSPEMLRRKLRRWSDKYGYGFLTFVKGN